MHYKYANTDICTYVCVPETVAHRSSVTLATIHVESSVELFSRRFFLDRTQNGYIKNLLIDVRVKRLRIQIEYFTSIYIKLSIVYYVGNTITTITK